MQGRRLLLIIVISLSFNKGGWSQCVDNYDDCGYWASTYECTITPAFMMCNCAASCASPTQCDPLSTNDTDCRCRGWASKGRCSETSVLAACPTTCFIRENAQCTRPDNITHAHHEPSLSLYPYLTLLEYACDEGYVNTGFKPASVFACNASAGWIISYPDNMPQCEWIVCGTPPTIAHASFEGTQFDYNSTVVYKCDAGFEATGGSDVRKCDGTASWSGSDLICERIDCGDPPEIPLAEATFTSTLFQDEAVYACVLGYNSTQTSVTKRCSEFRNWTGDDISCSIVTCPVPANIALAEVDFSGSTYLSVANYTCIKGYNSTGGDSSRTCGPDALWEGDDLVCEIVSCGSPPALVNTTLTFNNVTYQSEAEYACIKGHNSVGGSEVKQCMEDGSWLGVDLQCEVVSCGPPVDVEFTDWTADVHIYQSEARYSCIVGYEQKGGHDVKTCLETGFWGGENLHCEIISCGDPPPLPNAEVTHGNTTYLSPASYSCASGYEHPGSDVTKTCAENGTWVGPDIVCSAVNCGTPPTVPHAGSNYTLTTYPNSATFTCDKGYNSSRSVWSVTCIPDKSWQGELPVCKIIECGDPPELSKTEVSSSASVYLSTATYNCIRGYNQASGSDVKTCAETGDWTGDDLMCEIVDCGTPPEVSFATSVSNGSTYESNVTYSCITGYELMGGAPVKTCSEFGDWRSEEFNCTIVSCGEPPELSHIHVTKNYTRFYQSQVTYDCNLGYDVAGGNHTLTCTEHAQWKGERLRCKEKPTAAEVIGVIKKFEPEVVEASGSVGFGVGAYIIMGVILTGILLLDLATFYRHLKYMKENLTDFWESRKPNSHLSLPERNYASEA